MTPTQVENQLQDAMLMLTTVEEYEDVVSEIFDECSYTLFRGVILYAFTRALIKVQPQIQQGITDSYHYFLDLHFDPLITSELSLK